MASIVDLAVPSKEVGEEALDKHEGKVADVALVFKNNHGRVKIQQTSDMTVGKGLVRGNVLGAVASVFVGPLVGMAAGVGAVGAAYGALRDKGVSDKVMKLAGKQLEDGKAAVFVLADDDVAGHIAEEVAASGGTDVAVEVSPAEAQKVVKIVKVED
jgi:uncharacterized membrane protein